MKKLARYLLLLAAMGLGFVFASCKADDDDEPTYYTVTFDSDGGTEVKPQKIESGKKATKPETDPTKTATEAETYTFAGWYTSEDEGTTLSDTAFDFNTAITDNISLYAKWTVNAVTHTVSFNTNGGTPASIDSQVIGYGNTATKPANPTKEGYGFAGWYNGETVFDFDTAIKADITLKAKWALNTYTVSFNTNGGTPASIDSQIIGYGNTATKTADPTKEGYTFQGWFIDDTEFDFTTAIKKDIELTAKWTLNVYTVSFNTNGGTPASIDSQSVTHGNTATKPANPTKEESVTEAYIFENWYTSEDEGVTLSEEPFDFDTAITSDLKLYAKYGYKITYKNTKDVANSNAEVYTGEKAITLANLEKAGYIFDGWFDAETNGNKITGITKGSTGAKTFWAHWTLGTKDAPDAVGDIVLNNGRAIAYEDGLVFDDEVKASAIALIFYKGTELNSGDDTTTSRTLGVGLKHNTSGLEWCLQDAAAFQKKITTIQCKHSGSAGALTFTGDRNGSDNLEQIEAFDGVDDTATEANYPAFYFAKNYSEAATNLGDSYKDGWYLPSMAELFQIYANGKGASKVFDIDAASSLCGGDSFGTRYWSSSQYTSDDWCAYWLKFDKGGWDASFKHSAYYVCAVRAF